MPPISLQGSPASIRRSCLKLLVFLHRRRPAAALPAGRLLHNQTVALLSARRQHTSGVAPHPPKSTTTTTTTTTSCRAPALPDIPPASVLNLLKASHSPDVVSVYNQLMELLPTSQRDRLEWQGSPVFRTLERAISRIIDGIINASPGTPGLPVALEVIDHIGGLGVNVRKHYVSLLLSLLTWEAPVSEILPAFESAVRARMPSLDEVGREDVAWLFSKGRDSGKLHVKLYVVYLYLHHLRVSSPVLSVIDAYISHRAAPSYRQVKQVLRQSHSLSPTLISVVLDRKRLLSASAVSRPRPVSSLSRLRRPLIAEGVQEVGEEEENQIPSTSFPGPAASMASPFLPGVSRRRWNARASQAPLAFRIAASKNEAALQYGQTGGPIVSWRGAKGGRGDEHGGTPAFWRRGETWARSPVRRKSANLPAWARTGKRHGKR